LPDRHHEINQHLSDYPGVYSLSQTKGGHVHAFLLDGGKSLTLIDALYDADASLILDEIKQIPGRSSSGAFL